MKIKKQTAIWKSRSGKEQRLCDLETSHLENIAKLLEKKAVQIAESEVFYNIPCFQGEMAQYYAEMEMENTFDDIQSGDIVYRIFPIYEKVLLEIERRKNESHIRIPTT